MRELIYYVATTLDGFIAEPDGSFDGFPMDQGFLAALAKTYPETLPALFHAAMGTRPENTRFDTVLMGRKTYEVGQRDGLTNPYPTLQQIVFSRTLQASPDDNVELVATDAVARVRRLKEESGKAIWLCGGSILASTLLAAGLIDGLIVKLNPVLFGSGIPLFAPAADGAPTGLELTETEVFDSGHAVLQYRVRGG
ncbi:MAG: dihydrofolate reductase family protein [Acidobacteriota bacterium]